MFRVFIFAALIVSVHHTMLSKCSAQYNQSYLITISQPDDNGEYELGSTITPTGTVSWPFYIAAVTRVKVELYEGATLLGSEDNAISSSSSTSCTYSVPGSNSGLTHYNDPGEFMIKVTAYVGTTEVNVKSVKFTILP